jgi:DNA-binding MarR family transcriptional regulator
MNKGTRSVREDLKQSKPFGSTAVEGVMTLFTTVDRLRRRFEGFFAEYGITMQQYNVLRILRGAGQALPTMEVAERMIEQAPGVTRMIDRLEHKGLVERVRHADDRRQVLCSITPTGLELLARLDAPVTALDESALSMLDERDQRKLIQLLNAIRAPYT